ncbi:MAG TPA: transglycosylase SLT domain-containing protein [Cyclobacteriaceae bacterium]
MSKKTYLLITGLLIIFIAAIEVLKPTDKSISDSKSGSSDSIKALWKKKYDQAKDSLFVLDNQLYTQNWDQLPQPSFWYKIINMDEEISIINLETDRSVKDTIATDSYWDLPRIKREAFLDSLKEKYGMSGNDDVFITSGKQNYYQFDQVIPFIPKAVSIFKEEDVDPWFAQAIMLIESPASLQKSPYGAYGYFQLMSRVARRYGLKINRYVDEREDLEKSARVAARLLKHEYMPHAYKLLDRYKIPYNPNELWVKLLVLHVYHAGPATMRRTFWYLQPKHGGQELIKTLWITNYRNFQNASQNYSQIALASLMHFDRIMKARYNIDS